MAAHQAQGIVHLLRPIMKKEQLLSVNNTMPWALRFITFSEVVNVKKRIKEKGSLNTDDMK